MDSVSDVPRIVEEVVVWNSPSRSMKGELSGLDGHSKDAGAGHVPVKADEKSPDSKSKTPSPSSSKGSPSPKSGKSGTSSGAASSTGEIPMARLKSKKDLEEDDEREKMQLLVSNFSEEQYDRYEIFRRSTFPKAAIKRIMQNITGNTISQNAVIAMSGIAKVFVGEVVEEALDAMDRAGDVGPVRPKHLREAVRRLRNTGSIPRSNGRRFNPFPL